MNGNVHEQNPGTGAADTPTAGNGDFISLYCQKFNCPRPKFAKEVLRACLFPQMAGFGRLILAVKPRFFEVDFALIQKIQHTHSYEQLEREAEYHELKNAPEGLLRLVLNVRLSKQQLLNLARALFPPAG